MFFSQFSPIDVLAFLLGFVRIAAMSLTLPKLTVGRYLLMYRLLFALVLALVMLPLIAPNDDSLANLGPGDLVSLLIAELGVGLCLGLAASCTILGLVAAGQVISQLLGFQIGSLQQGLGADQATDYRKLLFVVGLFSWFAMSGHRFAVEGLLQSFACFPIGQSHFSLELLALANQLIGASLAFAVRFALPVLIVSLFGFLVAGFFSSVLGTGQSTSVAFELNQILFFLIGIPLLVIYSDEVYRHTASHVELLIMALTPEPPQGAIH